MPRRRDYQQQPADQRDAINDAWCRLFREHGFIIGLSLEGNEALQDYHRPDKRGRSTVGGAARH